jgi:RNA polymerase sigma-70 factor (ECF subfamily)
MVALLDMTRSAAAELEDHQIIARVVAGEHAGFEVLVRRYNQRLFRAARAITHSDADAEDVIQQAWLSVFRNLGQFRGEANFATWATRIAVREAISLTRKRPIVAEIVDAVSDVAPDAELARARTGALLESCLANIPQGNREVMVLRDVLELDTAETAACLGLSEEAVRVRLHRARAAIAAALTEQLADHAREIYRFDGARCNRVTAHVMSHISRTAVL